MYIDTTLLHLYHRPSPGHSAHASRPMSAPRVALLEADFNLFTGEPRGVLCGWGHAQCLLSFARTHSLTHSLKNLSIYVFIYSSVFALLSISVTSPFFRSSFSSIRTSLASDSSKSWSSGYTHGMDEYRVGSQMYGCIFGCISVSEKIALLFIFVTTISLSLSLSLSSAISNTSNAPTPVSLPNTTLASTLSDAGTTVPFKSSAQTLQAPSQSAPPPSQSALSPSRHAQAFGHGAVRAALAAAQNARRQFPF